MWNCYRKVKHFTTLQYIYTKITCKTSDICHFCCSGLIYSCFRGRLMSLRASSFPSSVSPVKSSSQDQLGSLKKYLDGFLGSWLTAACTFSRWLCTLAAARPPQLMGFISFPQLPAGNGHFTAACCGLASVWVTAGCSDVNVPTCKLCAALRLMTTSRHRACFQLCFAPKNF